MKKITLLLLFLFSVAISAQCGLEETIIICNMESIDGDGDGNPDGVINLYEEYTNQFGGVLDLGTWSVESSLSFPLNPTTGEVALWEYKFSSFDPAEVDYRFELFTAACGTTPAATIIIELGPYSGRALPPSGTNDVNFEVCEGTINLFETLVSNEIIPPPHINGVWETVGALPDNAENFQFLPEDGAFFTEIAYQEGIPLVDRAVFEFKYVVAATDNCALEETFVKVSVVRQVDPGNSISIPICESEMLSGNFDMDIDLRDDTYLLGEDEEGFWSSDASDLTNEISDDFDSIVNIRNLYDAVIASQGPRFGNETFTFTYSVPQRSGVCVDRTASIAFTIYEELRPFNQNTEDNTICLNETDETTSFRLIDFLDFANEGGVDFIYPNGSWGIVSSPPSPFNPPTTFLNSGQFSVFEDDTYILPGTYVFQYFVSPNTNGAGSTCNSESANVTIEILDFDYAGENNTDPLEFCETEGPIVLTDLLEIDEQRGDAIVATGIWTNDADGSTVLNNFVFPDVTADTVFNLTYTTTHTSGCTDEAMLSFTLINETSPGSTGTPTAADGIISICSNETTVDLFEQLDGEDIGGEWTGPGSFTSADGIIPIANLIAGSYTYTIGDGLSCTTIESTSITIEIEDFFSFDSVITMSYCKFENSIDLATLLDPTAPTNGTYTEDAGNSITGVLTGSVVDFTTLVSGTYNFDYTLDIGSCGTPAIQTFAVEVIDGENPASAGESPIEPISICEDDRTIDLFSLLEGTPSTQGIWTGPFGYVSADHTGEFNQNNQMLPILGPGTYTYTVEGGECNDLVNTAEVVIEFVSPIALGDPVFETFCKQGGGVNLYTLLDNNTVTTGVFSFDSELSGGVDFDEADLDSEGNLRFENLSNTEDGYNFTYSVPNVAPCDISSLNVQINIIEVETPEIGEASFCVLEGRTLEDINITDNGLLVNYYDSLLAENPITNNPVLANGDVYYVSLENATACESERVAVNVTIYNTGNSNCPLEFQDGVSPNGDGKNDTFSLNWINENYKVETAFPDYILEIYNRYGVIVYEANADTDEFDGDNNVSLSLGKDLPSGTYFYIFKPNLLNNPPIQGSFYLSK